MTESTMPPKRKSNSKSDEKTGKEKKSKYFKNASSTELDSGSKTKSPSSKATTPPKRKSSANSNEQNGEEKKSKHVKKAQTKEPKSASNSKNQRLTSVFYNQSCVDLSKALLGKKLCRKLPGGEILSAIIVETEAYLGGEDKAAHSYNGKKTPKNEAMYMPPGTAYVYHIYGAYTCFNVSSCGDGAAVLLRAVEPVDGIDTMKKVRVKGTKKADDWKSFKEKDIGNGPSKLTQAMSIPKDGINKQDLTSFAEMWLEPGNDISEDCIVSSPRIGIDYAEEWAEKPLRFYIKGNIHVSKKDKKAEENLAKAAKEKV